jgi:hypothetical protein
MELEFGYKLCMFLAIATTPTNIDSNLLHYSFVHVALDNLECDNLARWLHVLTKLCAVTDGEAAIAQLVAGDILQAFWFSHDRRRRISKH